MHRRRCGCCVDEQQLVLLFFNGLLLLGDYFPLVGNNRVQKVFLKRMRIVQPKEVDERTVLPTDISAASVFSLSRAMSSSHFDSSDFSDE